MLAAGAVDVLHRCRDVLHRCRQVRRDHRMASGRRARANMCRVHGYRGPAIHLHAATVPPTLRHLECFHDHVRIEAMLFDGVIQPSDGNLAPSDAPGNGYTLKTADAAPYRVAWTQCSSPSRRDQGGDPTRRGHVG
jgi:hypothetical protein